MSDDLIAQIRKEYPLLLTLRQYRALLNCSEGVAYDHLRKYPDLGLKIGRTTRIKREKAIELIFAGSPWLPVKDRPQKPLAPKQRKRKLAPAEARA